MSFIFGDFLCPDIFHFVGVGGGYCVVIVKTYAYMYFYLSFTIFYLSKSYPAYQIEKKDHIFLIFVSISYIAMEHVDSHRKYYKLLLWITNPKSHTCLYQQGKTQDNKYAVTWQMAVLDIHVSVIY